MTILAWTEQATGALIASGHWNDYLIAHDDRHVVLTRWAAGVSFPVAATQAALHVIQLSGAYDVVPEVIAGVVAHLKLIAQQYEDGLSIESVYPAWRIGPFPEIPSRRTGD